jgi:hypothetical protein
LKRAGQRINDAIDRAIEFAEQRKGIRRRGDFLWPAMDRAVPVRRRSGDPPVKIEFICDEEIAEAVQLVLKRQFATVPDDLIVRSSRLLGIQVTRDAIAERIKAVIEKLIAEKILQPMPNGMIDLTEP